MSRPGSHVQAIALALAGFSAWVLGDTAMKLAGNLPMPKYEIMMIGNLSGMIVICAVSFFRKALVTLRPKRFRGLLMLGCMYSCNYFILVWVLPRLPLANFYTFIFLAPLVIAIFAALFLGEHLSWKHGVAIGIGFCGVLVAVNPAAIASDMNYWLVYGATFAFMLTYAMQMLMLRILGSRETRECLAFYPRTIGLVSAAAAGVVLGFEPVPLRGVIYALISGACGGIGWLCMAQAYKLAPAATVAPFHYSQLVVGALLGYLIWQDVPTMHMLLGATIIISSGLYIAMHTRKAGALAKILAENVET